MAPQNPTPTPGEYQRDVGSGEQLGYGEATDANVALAAGDALEEEIAANSDLGLAAPGEVPAPEEDPTPVEYSDEDPADYQPASELEQILFGPAEGVGLERTAQVSRPIPNSVIRALPMLSAIVADPATPAAIRAAYRLLIQRMTAEQESLY